MSDKAITITLTEEDQGRIQAVEKEGGAVTFNLAHSTFEIIAEGEKRFSEYTLDKLWGSAFDCDRCHAMKETLNHEHRLCVPCYEEVVRRRPRPPSRENALFYSRGTTRSWSANWRLVTTVRINGDGYLTQVFTEEDTEIDSARTKTEEQARAAHKRLCAEWAVPEC